MSKVAFIKLKQRFTPLEALVFLLALLPACFQAIAVLKYSVNVPFYDDWDRVRVFQEVAQGTLSFSDLLALHNESRLFFPRLLTIALAFLTNWDVRYEMVVTFLLACLISFSVYRLGKLTIEGSRLKLLTLFLLSNLFIFAPVQSEIWLWGHQGTNIIPMACIAASLLILYSDLGTKTKLLTCMVLTTVSTFSFANGMAAWILLLPVVASSRTWDDPSRKSWLIVVWVMGFALNVALYFYGYQQPPGFPSPVAVLFHPVLALQYFLSFLGAPYSFGLPVLVDFARSAPYDITRDHYPALTFYLAPILGGMLLFLFASACVYLLYSLRNAVLVHQMLGWLIIGAYSVVSGLINTVGRVGKEIIEASLALRYPVHSLYLAVALIFLMPIVVANVAREGSPLRNTLFAIAFGSSRRRLFTTAFGSSLAVIVVFLHLLTSAYWIAVRFPIESQERSNAKACLLLIDIVHELQDDECLRPMMYHNVDTLRNLATIANEMAFLTPPLVESDKIRDIEGTRSKSADYGQFNVFTETGDDSYFAAGWAILPEEEKPADAVLLSYEDVDGEPVVFAVADMRKERPDVAEALGTGAYFFSGWQETFSLSAVPAGSPEIVAWGFDAETAKAFELTNTHVLQSPESSSLTADINYQVGNNPR